MAFHAGTSLALILVIAGVGLAIAEAMAPGAHLIVLGVALLGAGLAGLLLEPVIPGLAGPFGLGIMVLVFGYVALLAYRELDFYGGKDAGQTSDSGSLLGKTGRTTERVTNVTGQVELYHGGFDPFYAARSESGDIPPGTEVIVVDPGGGNVLTVESLEAAETDSIDRELAEGRAEE